VVSSAEDLAAPAEAFDLVVIGNAFHRMHRDTAAARILGWLRPGGLLALFWSGGPMQGGRAMAASAAGVHAALASAGADLVRLRPGPATDSVMTCD
jgi:hypothetical protein